VPATPRRSTATPVRELGGSAFLAAISLKRLRQQASLSRSALEDVNEADGGIRALDAGLDQRDLLGIAEPELVEPLGLGSADVARSRSVRRIGILVMPDQGLPVFVSRALHGFADLLSLDR